MLVEATSSSTSFLRISSCPTWPSAGSRKGRRRASARRLLGPGFAREYLGRAEPCDCRRAAFRSIARARDDRGSCEVEIARCDDAERRCRNAASNSRRCKAKARRVAYIDPVDMRYNRYETVPKPITQAVMFCLMDVSGSMTEQMKDLAKRFFMLLYVFLDAALQAGEIVFIRHTERARGSRRGYVLSRAGKRVAPSSRPRSRRCMSRRARAIARATGISTPRRPRTATTLHRRRRRPVS